MSPNAIKAWREAEVVSGAKSDAGDAEVIAEYLRLRFHGCACWPHSARRPGPSGRWSTPGTTWSSNASPPQPTRGRARRLLARGPATVRRDQPDRVGVPPGYPTPASAARLGESAWLASCTSTAIPAVEHAAELVERLRSAPPGVVIAEAEAEPTGVLAYVGVLRALNRAIASLDKRIAAQLAAHPQANLRLPAPAGSINAAQILAGWGDCRRSLLRPRRRRRPRRVTPVTKKSGKYHTVQFRWSCNNRFRSAITTFADNSRQASPWADDIYLRAGDRGCDHAHAIRILARAWIRVIYRCWITGQAYDPAKHAAAARLGAPSSDDELDPGCIQAVA